MCGLQVFIALVLSGLGGTLGDLAHYFSPEFGIFQQPPYFHHHQQHPLQYPIPPSHLYAPPQQLSPPEQLYHPPEQSRPSTTPAPVAPVPVSTTTEFTLPEIVENRKAKDHINFIPLQNHYLPPEERPTYESPKPPTQGNADSAAGNVGYYYPRPTPFATSSTTTTSERPNPIVVMDPPEFLGLPPPNEELPHGYDYVAPAAIALVPGRPSTPAPIYLPPQSFSEPIVVEKLDENSALRLRIQEMRCMPQQGGYFRTVLKVDSFIGANPSVDNDSNDKRCELKLSKSFVVVDIAEEDFHKCGVRACGRDLCLRLRFPSIRGMRTGSDSILTLHCKTQDRVAVKTHALKMAVANDVQSRSIGTYAHGGTQNPFRTHVEILRKSPNGYTRLERGNDVVQLGEDLLLRAHVISGDGWNYTKLSDVSLQRISPSGEVLNVAQLLTSNGCLNPSMHGVCQQPAIFDPPLGYKLQFKAVMFQGMRSGDEVVMSMRITGCLEHDDCRFNAQECSSAGGTLRRRKRNTTETVRNDTEVSEISRISFHVVMPDNERSGSISETDKDTEDLTELLETNRTLVVGGVLGFVILLICLGIFALLKLRRY